MPHRNEHTANHDVTSVLRLTKDKHGFYEPFGFDAEPGMAMMLRR